MVDTSLFLPSQWLSSLQHPDLQYELEALFGSTADLEEFWNSQLPEDPKWKGHPMLKKKNWKQKAIPVVIHGDGASYQKNDSLMTLSFSGLLKEGKTLDTNLVLACFPKSSSAKGQGGTWDCIWSWLVWDFNNLFHNKFSKKDPWGADLPLDMRDKADKPILADGFFIVVAGVLGDNDFMQNELFLPHWRHELPKPCCHLCTGNKHDKNWFDFRTSAPWKLSPPLNPASKHIINSIIGWTPFHFHLDWMHTVDLGCASHACANIIFEIVYVNLKHLPRAQGCQEVAAVLLEHSSAGDHGSSISSFELKHFVLDSSRPHQDYPELRKLKAAQIRALVKPVVMLAEKYSDGSLIWQHRLRMIRALNQMYNVIYANGIVLPVSQYNLLEKASNLFLQEYTYLARHALDASKQQYSVVPKFHYLFHIIEAARFMNPRWTWCYGGEDLVGSISSLAHSCADGTSSLLIQTKVMEKLRVAKHISWALA